MLKSNHKKKEALDDTDNRKSFDYLSKYEKSAKVQIWTEAAFLVFLLIITFLVIFFTWKGTFCCWFAFTDGEWVVARKYIYYSASGLLGGITFGMKYLYRVVARGYWHQDRRVWRLLSPIIAMNVAFMIGVLTEANFINGQGPASGAKIISIGFLAGYFADEAVGKMYEVANVLFGRSKSTGF